MTEKKERQYTADALSHLMLILGYTGLMAVFIFTDLASNLYMAICLTLAIPHIFFLRANLNKLRHHQTESKSGSPSS